MKITIYKLKKQRVNVCHKGLGTWKDFLDWCEEQLSNIWMRKCILIVLGKILERIKNSVRVRLRQ